MRHLFGPQIRRVWSDFIVMLLPMLPARSPGDPNTLQRSRFALQDQIRRIPRLVYVENGTAAFDALWRDYRSGYFNIDARSMP